MHTGKDVVVQTGDGRTLQVREYGTGDGQAVIFHHGWPSSRLLPDSWDEAAQARGVRLISFDRAGYGGSSRAPGRTVGDVAADTAVIAEALGADRFGVWGVSGGGPHALACAALIPERLTGTAVVAGAAPYDMPGLDYCAGMGPANQYEFPLAAQGPEVYEPYVRAAVEKMLAAGVHGDDGFQSVLSPVDRALMDSGQFDEYEEANLREALGGGIYGWLDDGYACVGPWGFELESIEGPVLLVQGGQDLMVPASHARAMAAVLPNATLEFHPDEGHMTLGMAPERSLDWLVEQTR